ncbi:MAG: tRNA (N(6)-L-threonylcarbamoyladenosine(37)-C(2))-methylthiotransferase [Candidatus Aenigmarchaeota archaeon]|nr:tRNA (N(6)-L-threonylcarbamoyladenosine(37)-C(2))-methylthiotransferase [Candidatus Aenigmarchaeota archaeon]
MRQRNKDKKRSIYIETYGCSANQSHSEVMMGLLKENGYNIFRSPEDAGVLVINTCIVKEPTEKRMIFRIKSLKEKYPDKKMIIAGCMPAGEYSLVKKIAPEASLVGPNNSLDIIEAVKNTLNNTHVEYLDDKGEKILCHPRIRFNKFINIVEISKGCLGNCAYCIVKRAKGILKSYPIKAILMDIEMSLKEGCKEVWLTSQDCGCYGRDIGVTLVDLINEISKIPGEFRVRIGMANPNYVIKMLKDLINSYKSDKIYKFLHIPVQSGSNEVLKKMRRVYTAEEFKEIVTKFKKNTPNVTVWTDVIVGFPGETEKDFKETLKLIEETKPDFVNISKFGVRPGTEAEKMKKVDTETIKRRSREISNLVDRISLEKNKDWIGRTCKILITEPGRDKNQYMGRNESYKPILIETEKNLLGKFVTVRIIDAKKTHLVGKII